MLLSSEKAKFQDLVQFLNFYCHIMLIIVMCMSAILRARSPTCTDVHLKRFCMHEKLQFMKACWCSKALLIVTFFVCDRLQEKGPFSFAFPTAFRCFQLSLTSSQKFDTKVPY